MASVVRRVHYHMQVETDPETSTYADVTIVSDPIQNERLGDAITRVLEVEIADQPTVVQGQVVRLMMHERVGDTDAPQFKGTIHSIDGTSYPNRTVWTCVSYNARLRKVPTHDHDLTGMTDGEAVRYILDQCNVPYASGAIKGAGYELGAVRPVYWLKDQPGWEMIQQLDDVFGFATMDVEQSTAVRIKVDRVPQDANIVKTYTRGVDAEFWANTRNRGGPDDVINAVNVQGLSWTDDEDEPGADGCTRTYWARAEGFNDALGDDEYNRGYLYSSDLIQSAALAKSVARRLIRWYNRMPDEITLRALNDLDIRPGVTIGVKDEVYGVDLTAGADDTPYLVYAVDRRGEEMTLQCVGGVAGTYDTLTSGVEKVCNKDGETEVDDPLPWEDDAGEDDGV